MDAEAEQAHAGYAAEQSRSHHAAEADQPRSHSTEAEQRRTHLSDDMTDAEPAWRARQTERSRQARAERAGQQQQQQQHVPSPEPSPTAEQQPHQQQQPQAQQPTSSSSGGGASGEPQPPDPCDLPPFRPLDLTSDHKVLRPDELARVLAAGAQVDAAHADRDDDDEEFEPARIYEDLAQPHLGPGLTMTRAFGDWGARRIGLTHAPEITRRALQPSDRFLILASDGVWEFIDSALAVEIVGALYESGQPAQLAALSLITAAANRWYACEGQCYRDDITCIVVYLDELLLPTGTASSSPTASDRRPREDDAVHEGRGALALSAGGGGTAAGAHDFGIAKADS
jgi:hypothetical protein